MKQHRKGKVKWIPHIILCILVLTIACSTAYATEAYQTGQQVEANAISVEKNTSCACERDAVNVGPVITRSEGQLPLSASGREFQVSFAETAGLIEISNLEYTLSMELVGVNQGRMGQPHQEKILYQNVWEKADLVYTVYGDHVKEEIILRQPNNLKKYTFKLSASKGLTPKLNDDGGILVITNTDDIAFMIPPPFAVDAKGKYGQVHYELSNKDSYWLVDMVLDEAWFNSFERAYPITIDPTIYPSAPKKSQQTLYFNVNHPQTLSYTYTVQGHQAFITYSCARFAIRNPSGEDEYFVVACGNQYYTGAGEINVDDASKLGQWSVWVFSGGSYTSAYGSVTYYDLVAPGNPHGTTESDTSIKWQWDDNQTLNENGYRIYEAGTNNLVGTAPAGSTSYTETGLIPGTVYNRQVVAYTDMGGNGPRSAVMSQTTAADTLAPIAHAPTPQERRTSDNTPIWTWPASSDASGILRYEIQQKAASASWPNEWIIVGQNTFWESHSLPDGDYNARIRAVDNAGNVGPPSAERTITVVQTGKVFFHNDHLGSPRVVTGSSGEVLHVMEYKPFGQPHEVLVTSVIPMDRPLEAATDLAGRMVGPVTVITDDKMVGAVSLKVESGDDPHYSNANYGPVNPPEYDANEYRYVALWVKPGSGAEYVQFDVRDASEGRFETIRADIGDDPDIWSSENGRFYVGQELDQDKWYLILLDLKQTNHGGVLGQVSQFQWYTNENSTWQWDGIKSATVSQNLKQYRFTGKEPDDNGLLYFGARYYDPEVGRFITEDPARDGLNWYLYCYANPLGYVDPEGLTTYLVHGTWSGPDTWGEDFKWYISTLMNDDLPENTFMWSGGCALEDRLFAAIELATYIEKTWDGKSPINLIGHSHGGNVAIEAANILGQKGLTIDTLITIQTPVLKEHQLTEGNVEIHMNFYGALDPVQKLGGHGLTSPLLPTANQYKDGDWGLAGRTFANARNYQITSLSIHTQYYNDVKFWRINLARHINQIPYLKPYLNMK